MIDTILTMICSMIDPSLIWFMMIHMVMNTMIRMLIDTALIWYDQYNIAEVMECYKPTMNINHKHRQGCWWTLIIPCESLSPSHHCIPRVDWYGLLIRWSTRFHDPYHDMMTDKPIYPYSHPINTVRNHDWYCPTHHDGVLFRLTDWLQCATLYSHFFSCCSSS